jgi:hypothetical protein
MPWLLAYQLLEADGVEFHTSMGMLLTFRRNPLAACRVYREGKSSLKFA